MSGNAFSAFTIAMVDMAMISALGIHEESASGSADVVHEASEAKGIDKATNGDIVR